MLKQCIGVSGKPNDKQDISIILMMLNSKDIFNMFPTISIYFIMLIMLQEVITARL